MADTTFLVSDCGDEGPPRYQNKCPRRRARDESRTTFAVHRGSSSGHHTAVSAEFGILRRRSTRISLLDIHPSIHPLPRHISLRSNVKKNKFTSKNRAIRDYLNCE